MLVYFKHGIWREVKYQHAVFALFSFSFLMKQFVGSVCKGINYSRAVKKYAPAVIVVCSVNSNRNSHIH